MTIIPLQKLFAVITVAAALLFVGVGPSYADNRQITGPVEWVRVHDLGYGYGAPSDHLNAEVIVKLKNSSDRFGFQLRQDENLPVRYAMLDMLLDAQRNGDTVRIDYKWTSGRNTHEMYLVWAGL